MANLRSTAELLQAADIINQMPQETIAKMCFHIIRDGLKDAEQIQKDSCSAERSFSIEEVQGAVNALTCVFRSSENDKVRSSDVRTSLLTECNWKESVCEIVEKAIQQKERSITTQEVEALNVGKLVDLKWKVGMTTSSSDCKIIKNPFVTMVFTVLEPSGQTITKSCELSIQEFKKFSTQMQDMANVLNVI